MDPTHGHDRQGYDSLSRNADPGNPEAVDSGMRRMPQSCSTYAPRRLAIGLSRCPMTPNPVRRLALNPVRFGAVPQKGAETIKARVEELLACKVAGIAWSRDLAVWVGGLGDVLAAKLDAVGLIPRRHKSTLGDFLDGFLQRRANGKPNSQKNYKQAAGKLCNRFGRDIDMRAISHGMAEAWAMALTEQHAKAYAGRLVKFARQFFNLAIREKLITEIPLNGIKAQAQANESRKFFVSREMAQGVLDACPRLRMAFDLRPCSASAACAALRKF
jgi:hypothetical protein